MPAELLCTQSSITGTLLVYIGAKWLHITVYLLLTAECLSKCMPVIASLHFNARNLAGNINVCYIWIYSFMYKNVFLNICLVLLKHRGLSIFFHTKNLEDLQLLLSLEHFKRWVFKQWQGKRRERRAADCFLKAVWRCQCTDSLRSIPVMLTSFSCTWPSRTGEVHELYLCNDGSNLLLTYCGKLWYLYCNSES